MSDMHGKVALVTGSARGIGKAIAERFGRLGASVVVNYSASEQPARDTVAEIERLGGSAIAVQADVARVADIERLFAIAIERFGHLDIVVANAGLEQVDHPIAEVSEADFDRLYGVNAKGAFFTMQYAAKHVVDQGRIIYIGSSTTSFPTPGHGLYGSSKLAPQFIVEVLAKEVGGRGVTVNSILPSATEGAGVSADEVRPAVREFVRQFHPIQRMGTLDDIANAVEFLAGEQASFVSGQHLLLSGGGPA
jgi:3-oxoacyl-[acyl-carrier protein] reductase